MASGDFTDTRRPRGSGLASEAGPVEGVLGRAGKKEKKEGEKKIWAGSGLQEKKKKEGEGVGWAEKREGEREVLYF